METSFRLFSALVFLVLFTCIVSTEFRDYKVLIAELQDISADRNLQPASAKLKIKLTSSQYASQNILVTLQDPCLLDQPACIRNPAYTQNQIPQPIKLPLLSSTPSLVYEYTGYFTSPISLDIYTTGLFTKRHYSDLGLTGTFLNQTSLSTLYYLGHDGAHTSSFEVTGSILGPKSGLISCSMSTNDAGTVSINNIQVYSSWTIQVGYFNYLFEKDKWYDIRILINNPMGTRIGMELKWNIDGSYQTVDSDYMYPFTRESGIPYLLNDLKHNTYCDDLSGFRCVVCDGLCLACEDNSSEKVCTSCKPNSTLLGGQCICIPTFYLSAADTENCTECTLLCNECEEVNLDYRCTSCKPNFILLDGDCFCSPTFYLSASDPSSCKECTGLCNECEEVNGEYRCISCKPNAQVSGSQCICNPTFYLSASDPSSCRECTGLCNECEEVNLNIECITCKDNTTPDVASGQCLCNPTFYISASDPNNCKECTGLCNECKEEAGSIKCIDCKDNATLNTILGICSCNDEHYLTVSNPTECLKCNPLCFNCEERSGSQVCLACKDFARLESNDCVCNEGYYKRYFDYNPLRCYECPHSCATCEEDSDGIYCTSCKGTSILLERTCECGEGLYLYDEASYECKLCERLCRTCNRLECTRCVENAEIISGKCYCKEGYHLANPEMHECYPCPLNCEICNNSIECMNCVASYYLQTDNNQCLESCPIGYYGDSITGVCESCPDYCKSCTSYSRCDACYSDYLNIDQEGIISCIEKCPVPYIPKNEVCECDLINAELSDNICTSKEFELDIQIKDNAVYLHFSKQLANNLMLKDMNQTFYNIEIAGLISYDLYTLVDLLIYKIVYHISDDINIIQINLTLSDAVKDVHGVSLNTTYYYVEVLFNFDESSDNGADSKNNALAKTIEHTPTPTTIAINIGIGISILSLNLDPLWRFLNTIQIMLYLPLLCVNLPESLEQYYKDKNDYKSYPYLFTNLNSESPRPYSKAYNFGFSEVNFLYNSRKPVLFLLILTFLHIVIVLLSKYAKGKIKSACIKLSNLFVWNLYLRYFLQMYLELAILSSLNIIYVRYT